MPPSLKRRLLAGGLWVVAGKVVTAGSRLAATALLTRMLSQEAVGAFGLAFTLVTAAAMMSQVGLQQAVVRLVAESLGSGRGGRARAAIGHVFRYGAAGIAAVAVLLLAGGGAWLAGRLWDSPLLAASMGAVVVWIVFWSFQILVSETYRGFQDLRGATVFGGVITWILTLSALLALQRFGGGVGLGGVLRVLMIATGISVVLGGLMLARRVRRLPAPEPLPSREVLSISLPMWVTSLTSLALFQSDLWILGAFCSKAEVAVYFAATQLVTLVTMSLLLVNLVVPPFIADLYARGEMVKLQRILRTTATVAGLPALGALLAFTLFGAPILGTIYGEPFRAGATVLALLSVGKLFNVYTGSCGVTMGMTGHQNILMVITVATSVLTVGGCLMVVRPYGLTGVASIMCAGGVIQNLAMWLATRWYTGLWTHFGLPRLSEVRSLLR